MRNDDGHCLRVSHFLVVWYVTGEKKIEKHMNANKIEYKLDKAHEGIFEALASNLFEHWIARRVLHPPVAVMMGFGERRVRERLIGRWIVGRYYEPLPKNMRLLILQGVSRTLGKEPREITDPEDVFQVAFPAARKIENVAGRMDEFRKLYGFSRNIALAGLIGSVAIIYRGGTIERDDLYWWSLVVFLVSVMMFGRFLKFYAAYGAEVLRTYASLSGEEKRES